ncbi:MAG: hypothetical protein RIB41_13210 [Oceanibaculum nanhaiense]|uniref:hypothetical protein n=1 Tax=Oceanibaculum nanhaiense TaxID=1909734 RepID=UPI0032EE61D8
MGFYDRMAQSALRLIAEKGASLTYRRLVQGFDPLTGATVTASTDYGVTGVVQEASPGPLDNAMVRRGDRLVLVAAGALPLVPEAGSVLLLEGSEWSIVHVGAIKPGDTAIAWRLQVRR